MADFDWSTGRDIWANSKPMDNARVLIEQAAKVKAINPSTHVWVYRNLVKALSWYKDVGEKLSDPAYSGWFLQFDSKKSKYASPPCTEGVCSRHYHSQDQTPQHLTGRKECKEACDCGGVPCGEYIWDHRNASLRDWLVQQHVMGAELGMGNPNVTGFYFDDYWIKSGEGWASGPSGLPVRGAKDVNLSDCKTGPSEIQVDCLQVRLGCCHRSTWPNPTLTLMLTTVTGHGALRSRRARPESRLEANDGSCDAGYCQGWGLGVANDVVRQCDRAWSEGSRVCGYSEEVMSRRQHTTDQDVLFWTQPQRPPRSGFCDRPSGRRGALPAYSRPIRLPWHVLGGV